jgi:hypothetical protein
LARWKRPGIFFNGNFQRFMGEVRSGRMGLTSVGGESMILKVKKKIGI